MSAEEILQQARMDGIIIAHDGSENINLTGDQAAVHMWIPTIRKNKPEILEALAPIKKRANTPTVCIGCGRLRTIDVQGKGISGCLYLAQGQYFDGWRRLPDNLESCIWN